MPDWGQPWRFWLDNRRWGSGYTASVDPLFLDRFHDAWSITIFPSSAEVPLCSLTCIPLAVFADCTPPPPPPTVNSGLPPSIARECLQTPIVPHGASHGPLLCADGGHMVCPGQSLLTGRLRIARQSSEGACAPWWAPPAKNSRSLGWLAAPSQVNLRIVLGAHPVGRAGSLGLLPLTAPLPWEGAE